MKNLKKSSLLVGLIIYLLTAAGSYAAFNYFLPSGVRPVGERAGDADLASVEKETLLTPLLEIDPNDPKTEECPLSGDYYTTLERDSWEKRRPLAVMIENHPDARPQSGLSNADIVFEAVAEGGVTRFMGLFYCDAQAFEVILAPVRSARTYFVDWASGFNRPLYAHIGGGNTPGPADAQGQLGDYGWRSENDIDGVTGVGYPTFVRDYNRLEGKKLATEHTMVSSTELLWAEAEERGWTNRSPERQIGYREMGGDDWQEDFEPWTFLEDVPADGTVNELSYTFWSGYNDYAVRWVYNPETQAYQRFMGGEAHLDLNTEKQIEAKNVIVLKTTEKGPIDELKHMLYGTTGTGEALIHHHGQVIEATWTKKTRTDELHFVDSRGQDVPLARGLTWISVVNNLTEVNY